MILRRLIEKNLGPALAAGALALGAITLPARGAETANSTLTEPMREADKSYAEGVWLFADGDLTGALAAFRRAYAVFPNVKVLYNIGGLQRQLHDWAGALRTYRKYLDGSIDLVPPERRAQVEGLVTDLGQKISRIQVEAEGGRSELTVDDQAYALSSPDQAVEVNPGRHRIRVNSPHLPAQTRTVDLASGDRLRLVFEIVPVAVVPKPVVVVPAPILPHRPDPR